jgi:amino acid adenylation domain-containing protein
VETYAAIIASWLTGKAYVPIPAHYPAVRIEEIIQSAEIGALFYAAEDDEIANLKSNFPKIDFINAAELPEAEIFFAFPDSEKTAYVLFTSGTTGKPKGVPISFGNLQAFMNGFDALGYEVFETDRFLQMFELTFDLSVVCFAKPLCCGASFHTLPGGMIKTLALYHVLEENRITISLMVPSAIGLLLPYLEDIFLPELRISQFCGEALKKDLLKKWRNCVPNARIDNVYGPTEATIYCTALTCKQDSIPHHNGVVGIGKPMQGTELLLMDEQGSVITESKTVGELCLGGQQITSGYLNNEVQNRDKFFTHNHIRYYKSGDMAYRDRSGNYFYVGRKDDQIKIQGYRIELAELEVAAQRIMPDTQSVAIGYQADDTWYLALFIKETAINESWLQDSFKTQLPAYMRPHRILVVDEIPLNANGKTDRKALRILAENQH